MILGDLTVLFMFLSYQPYDFLSLIPVIEGAGGIITDWKGHHLCWDASPDSRATSMVNFFQANFILEYLYLAHMIHPIQVKVVSLVLQALRINFFTSCFMFQASTWWQLETN